MNERNMSIVYSSELNNITEYNSSFDKGVLRVCYTGKNRNNSFISKETFEQCLHTIYNCPIVCRYGREDDEIGAHDIELVSDDRGLRIVNMTHPVGVIAESASTWWEEIEDDSGLHEYLCVDALLWKRQEAYSKIKDDGITAESMEISIKEGEMIDGVYVIKRFEFTAFCLLGTAAPCFESASLELFSCDNFKDQLAEMMLEFKETLSQQQSSEEVVIYTDENNSEGGKVILEQKIALLEEFGLNAEQLSCDLENFTLEELHSKCEEIVADNSVEDKFALAEQFREELTEALRAETVETCFGEMSRYWFVDYDAELMEVYCYDNEDWKLYGLTYSMNGDNVLVDFASRKRKKFAITDFDDGEQQATFSEVFNVIAEKVNADKSALEQKYQEASDTISSMETELESLRKFKGDTEDGIAEKARNDVFAQFEDLANIEAFEQLKSNCKEFTAEVLEEKCYAIRGRCGVTAKFSYESKLPKLPVERTNVAKEPYGGIFAEYGISAPIKNN